MNSISMLTKNFYEELLKKTFSLSSFFSLSLHQTTKEFLAFAKAAIHAFVTHEPSALIDSLIFKGE